MNNVDSAVNTYSSLYFAEQKVERLTESLNKQVANLSPEEMQEYAARTLKIDKMRDTRNAHKI